MLYISDLPKTAEEMVATFADDVAVLTIGNTVKEATGKHRKAMNIFRLKYDKQK